MSMSIAAPPPQATGPEPQQRVVLPRIGWSLYEAILQGLGERRAPRLVYLDRDQFLMTKSRRHAWFAERLAQLVWAVAQGGGIACEDAAETTFRRADLEVGVMGDKTFYLGAHAERMRGPRDVDPAVDPPPDLAIEVEISHAPAESLEVYRRLQVGEVWHLVGRPPLSFQILRFMPNPAGTYAAVEQSGVLPALRADSILEQLRQAEALGATGWFARLPGWVASLGRQAT
jgi:Uma2 family endonuclease